MITFRKFWTQAHWLIGITAGSLLMLIGLTGAVLSFREELIDAINPGGRQVEVREQPALSPEAVAQAMALGYPGRALGTIGVYAAPGRATRVIFAPLPGERRGETFYVDPYTAAALPALKGAAFFELAEALHRWLLLPREPGRVATGVLAIGLLVLSLSGLYLRWPRKVLDWRLWWHIDGSLTGRAFLRRLHLVLGTVCLPLYVIFTATGLYWAFDSIRDPVSAWLGEPRPPRLAVMPKEQAADKGAVVHGTMEPAWQAFLARAGDAGWREAVIRVPGTAKAAVQITWLDRDPAHERARNRMTVKAGSGQVTQDERHDAKPVGGRALAAIYPLHMGTYFGLPGRIAMTIASLGLVFFGVTGWMLYLGRRRLAREAAVRKAGKSKPGEGEPGQRVEHKAGT